MALRGLPKMNQTLKNQLSMMYLETEKYAIVYHANCIDGLSAFAVALDGLKHKGVSPKDIVAVPGYYNHKGDFEFARNHHVYIVDFSYKAEHIAQIVEIARSVTLIDHHQLAYETIHAELPFFLQENSKKFRSFCNHKESGALLTWRHFFPDEEPPAVVRHVSDRDTWTFAMEQSREVHAALSAFSSDPWTYAEEFWHVYDYASLKQLYREGEVLMNRFQKDLGSVLHHVYNAVMPKISDHPIPVLNASGMFASEAGNRMALNSPSKMAIIWTMQKDGLKLMLRSSTDGPDVAKICKKFWGGGGHTNAAGATLTSNDDIQEFLFHILP